MSTITAIILLEACLTFSNSPSPGSCGHVEAGMKRQQPGWGKAIAAAAPVQVKKTCQLTREYLSPARIVLVEGEVKDADNLVAHSDTSFIFTGTSGQAMVNTKGCAMLRNVDGQHASVILDFGHELHGGIRIVTGKTKGHEALVRITLGESVSEAMSDIEPDGVILKKLK